MRYYIIIPAHNEAGFIEQTLHSLSTQTLAPAKIIIVNDNSTDGTERIIDSFSDRNPAITKLSTQSSTEHLPGSKVINAFNKGLSSLDSNYDFIVKLDADIILPANYFEQIAAIFSKNPDVGIAGGFAYEQDANGDWKLNHPMNKNHVRGAFKAYTRLCFDAIGGLKNAIGWDTVDELLAQYHGYKIYTDDNLRVKHLRPTGHAYNKKAKLMQGKAMYIMRYGICITLIASLKMALKNKNWKVFFANLQGYYTAKKEQVPFLVNEKEGKFIRSLRWKNMKKKFL